MKNLLEGVSSLVFRHILGAPLEEITLKLMIGSRRAANFNSTTSQRDVSLRDAIGILKLFRRSRGYLAFATFKEEDGQLKGRIRTRKVYFLLLDYFVVITQISQVRREKIFV